MYLPQQNGFVSVSISTPGYMNGEVFKNGLNGEFSPDLSSFEEYESDSLNESKSGEADKVRPNLFFWFFILSVVTMHLLALSHD